MDAAARIAESVVVARRGDLIRTRRGGARAARALGGAAARGGGRTRGQRPGGRRGARWEKNARNAADRDAWREVVEERAERGREVREGSAAITSSGADDSATLAPWKA